MGGVLPYVLCPRFIISLARGNWAYGSPTSYIFDGYIFRRVRVKKLSPRISCFDIDFSPLSLSTYFS